MIIDFYDNEETYGRIETSESIEKIEKLLEKYRDDCPEYNIDDFFDFLREKGIKFEELQLNADRSIFF